MADAFRLKIISPASVVVDDDVRSVEVPGSEGDFGVLPGHAPFFSMIRAGVLTVRMADGSPRRFTIASGYADVSASGCTILSDHIEDCA
jgi:F-type H+-transporting ATPase subunit epsilon